MTFMAVFLAILFGGGSGFALAFEYGASGFFVGALVGAIVGVVLALLGWPPEGLGGDD